MLSAQALERTNTNFKIFQFPADQIPTVDGNFADWAVVPFRLMPLEPQFRKAIAAQWSFHVVDMDRRLVAFKDLSEGRITSWEWDFGDGETSAEQHPQHASREGGKYVVTLRVEGPAGKPRCAKVWDLAVKCPTLFRPSFDSLQRLHYAGARISKRVNQRTNHASQSRRKSR